ncbi:neurofilament heavy polypeptide-like isoform X2 [Cloeon dipterum]|uniref:neurofilament heavy polypeptide-like isoform X2 n=1 Tax=Cloeon dipterum TaxID=197152 RepID=UPI00321F982F
MMMETQDINYIPSDAKTAAADVSRDRDNPVGYLIVNDQEEPIYKEKTTIGRETTADIVIDAPQISRLHATVKANLAEGTIFVCVYGKNNYLKLLELDPEVFYQVTDGDTLDFRSIKATYKENKKPDNEEDSLDEAIGNGQLSQSIAEEEEKGKEKEDKMIEEDQKDEDKEDKTDEDEKVDEGECTQFEFDSPVKADKEEKADKSLSPAASNPFLDESDMTPPKPRDSGFRLQRLPSFETQEQEVSELETQAVDEPMRPPPEPKAVVEEKKLEETQNSTLQLCVSLDNDSVTVLDNDIAPEDDNETVTVLDNDTVPEEDNEAVTVLDNDTVPEEDNEAVTVLEDDTAAEENNDTATELEKTPDHTQSPSQVVELPQSLCEARKALFDDEDSEDSLQIIEIDGKVCQPKVAVKDEKVDEEPSSQSSPVATKRSPSPVESPEKPASLIDESTIIEESSDGIVEGSDDESLALKQQLLVKDTQDQTLDESNLKVTSCVIEESDGEDQEIIEDTQTASVDNSTAWDDSENVTTVEVTPKKQSEETEQTTPSQEKPSEEVPIPEEKEKVEKEEQSEEPEIPQKESTELAEEEPVEGETPQKEEETVAEASPEEVVATPKKSAARKKRLSVSPVKRSTRASRAMKEIEMIENAEEEEALPEKEEEAPEEPVVPEETKPDDKPDGKEPEPPVMAEDVVKTPQLKRGRKPKKAFPSKKQVKKVRENSPGLDISIAEEVKMSPRAAKVVAEEKLPRGRRKKAEPKVEEPVEQRPTRGSVRKSKDAPAELSTPPDSKVKSEAPKKGGARRKVAKAPAEQEQKESEPETEERKGRGGRKRAGKAAAESEPPVKSPKKSPKTKATPEEPIKRTRNAASAKQTPVKVEVEEEPPKEEKPAVRTRSGRVSVRKKFESEDEEDQVPKSNKLRKTAPVLEVKEEAKPIKTPRGRPPVKKAAAVKVEVTTPAAPAAPAARATRRGRPSSSVTSSGDSLSRTRTKYCVFFSGFEGPTTAEKDIVAKLGGQTKDDVPDVRHKGEEFILVVNGTLKRTLKVLDFIGFGAPIVSQEWLKACNKANCFVDAWDYILKDKAAEKKFGFDLKECLLKASKERNVFKGWNVFFTPNVTPKGQCLKNCVVGLGGKFLPTKLKKWPDNLMIVSCEVDKAIYEAVKRDSKKLKNVLIVTVQGFFECLQQQKIVCLEQYSL